MAAGIQVFDAQGNLIVDITDRLAKFIGATYISANNGSVNDPALSAGGDIIYAFQQDRVWGFINSDISRPVFSISAGSIAWTYSPGAGSHNVRLSGWLFYGTK